MNASKLSTVERLAEELVARLTIELEASGRHVHLSRADVETCSARATGSTGRKTCPSRGSSPAPSG